MQDAKVKMQNNAPSAALREPWMRARMLSDETTKSKPNASVQPIDMRLLNFCVQVIKLTDELPPDD